jgi:hypothetical protein
MVANGGNHARTRSISEVIRTSRKRAQSVTAGEVVEKLKAPISYKLIVSFPVDEERGKCRLTGANRFCVSFGTTHPLRTYHLSF